MTMSSSAIMSSSSSESSPITISVRRSSCAAVGLLDLEQLLADQRVDPGRVAEDRAQLGDPLLQVGVLGLDLLAREAGEPREAEVEDRLGLDLGEAEARHQALCGPTSVSSEPRIRAITASRLSSAIR